MADLLTILKQAGFKGEALRTAWAVAMRESGGRAEAFNGNAGTGDRSYGLFQINMLGSLGPERMKKYGLSSERDLLDPVTNAKVAYQMTNGGQNWFSWDIDSNGYDGGSHAAAYQAQLAKYPGDGASGPDLKTPTGSTAGSATGAPEAATPAAGTPSDPGDLNGDGKVNKKDTLLAKDEISAKILGRDYHFASRIVNSNSEISTIFKDAVAGGWSKERFEAALTGTKWYNEQGSDYARKAWFARAEGGNDWKEQLRVAKDAIQRAATEIGAVLAPDELDQWAEKYMFNGWFDSSRQGLMMDALAKRLDITQGSAAKTTLSLKALAEANGLSFNDTFYTDTAKSITRGDSTMATWEQYLRDEAAKRYPIYGDKVRAGASVRDLASPYLTRMADLLELNQNDIKLDDPYIKDALGGVDATGKPTTMNYSDFETKLRKDPRWQNTINGKTSTVGLAARMFADWGLTK